MVILATYINIKYKLNLKFRNWFVILREFIIF